MNIMHNNFRNMFKCRVIIYNISIFIFFKLVIFCSIALSLLYTATYCYADDLEPMIDCNPEGFDAERISNIVKILERCPIK